MAFTMLHCWCADGHSTGTLSQELTAVTGASVSTAVYRPGNTASLQHTNGFGQDCYLPFPSSMSSWVFGCSMRIPALNVRILQARLSSRQFYVNVSAAGGIVVDVYDGPDYTGSVSGQVAINTWFWIAIKATMASGSGGSLQVAVNGVECINVTGVSTSEYGTSTSVMVVDGPWSSAVNIGGYVVGTGDLPSDTMIVELPITAGSADDFTPSASTNVSCVDDAAPDGDTTHNVSSTTGQRDLFVVGALPSGVAGVAHGLQVVLFASTDSASRTIKAISKKSGTEVLSSAAGVNVGYASRGYNVFLNDPSTGSPWGAASAIVGSEIGYEIQAP
jgi:hypothetical protein